MAFVDIARIERAEQAEDITLIHVDIEYKKSRTWGSIPHAEAVAIGEGVYHGSASGYGYDKTSAAVAEAFNQSPGILKILYSIKEKALAEGKTDHSATACTRVDNRELCGYGAGYTTIPYFEGGVGVSCFWSILERAGFKTSAHYGKREDFFTVTKEQ